MKNTYKVLIILTIAIFIGTNNVYAESGKLVGQDDIYAKDIYSPPTARFYDFDLNSYALTAISTYYGDGSGFYPDPNYGMTTNLNGPGSLIGYDVHDVFITGYVYSVITYLCAIPSSAYPMINTYRTGIQTGSGLANTTYSYANGGRANVIFAHNQQSTTPVTGLGNFYCGRLIYVFEATNNGTTIVVPFISSQTVSNWIFFGYSITNYGARNTLTSSDIQNIVSQSTNATYQAINSAESNINTNINNTRSSINNTIQSGANQIDNTLNNMNDQDIDNTTKEEVNTNTVDNTQNNEDTLLNMTDNTNMSIVDVGIDITSSNKIWELITRILNQNAKVMQMFISILSVGIIKLILRR